MIKKEIDTSGNGLKTKSFKSMGKYLKYILIYLLINSFSLSFGQRLIRRGPHSMFAMGLLGFLFFVLIFLLFSIIFWVVYLFLVKGKSDKDKKDN
jgi:uncharacterized membrane protein